MKNSLIILITSVITLLAFRFEASSPTPLNKAYNTEHIDSLKNRLDSLENYKNKILDVYATEIKSSYETIKKEEKQQEELNMSIDSVYSLVSTNDSINKQNIN
jgi:hypothetical protein